MFEWLVAYKMKSVGEENDDQYNCHGYDDELVKSKL